MTIRELIAALARIPNFDAKVYVQTGGDQGDAVTGLRGISMSRDRDEVYLDWWQEYPEEG